MKNNNGIFITAMRSGVTYSSFARHTSRHSKLQHNIIHILCVVASNFQLSMCTHQAAIVFLVKNKAHQSPACAFFFLSIVVAAPLLLLFFSSFFFHSLQLLSTFHLHRYRHTNMCIKWKEATWFGHPLQLLYSSLSLILFAWYGMVWYGVVWCGVVLYICACRVLFRNSFIWGALITLHVRVRIKSNRYAHTNSCARIFYSLRDIKILLHWFLFISFESLALEL